MSQNAQLVPVSVEGQVLPGGMSLHARLAEIDKAAQEHVNKNRPKNTVRSFNGDWKVWQQFCVAAEVPELTYSPGLLVLFVEWLDQVFEAPYNTLQRRVTGVVYKLREAGIAVPHGGAALARQTIKDIIKRNAEAGNPNRGTGQAPAVTIKQLKAISRECPDTLAGLRDRALVLIAFGIGGRRSEVASLLVTDIVESEQGLEVTVRFGKTGGRTVAVPRGTSALTCPARAWRAWVEASGVTEGPAFRRVDRHGRLLGGLSAQAAGDVVTRAGERAGVEARLTGHSMRAGMATEARKAGHDQVTIADQGGWVRNSAALLGYLRRVDQWSDNALSGIGL